MALVKINGFNQVKSTTKSSIISDVESIIDRVSRVLKGDTKFLDANMKQTSAALKRLQEAKGFLEIGLVPTSEE